MAQETYIIDCSVCGEVPGYVRLGPEDDLTGGPTAEGVVDEDEVETTRGPADRVRCPKCGRWVDRARVRPAG